MPQKPLGPDKQLCFDRIPCVDMEKIIILCCKQHY